MTFFEISKGHSESWSIMASNIPEVLQGVKLANFARFDIACSNTYFREYTFLLPRY